MEEVNRRKRRELYSKFIRTILRDLQKVNPKVICRSGCHDIFPYTNFLVKTKWWQDDHLLCEIDDIIGHIKVYNLNTYNIIKKCVQSYEKESNNRILLVLD